MVNSMLQDKGNSKQFALPKAGMLLNVVLQDKPYEQGVVLASRLWEIRKGHLLLQQTNPPIPPASVGMGVQVSYLQKIDNDNLRRLGFTASLRSVVDLPNNGGQILLVPVPEVVSLVSLRSLMRVAPAPEPKLSASLQMEGLSVPMAKVIDISIGGAKLMSKGALPLSEGQRLALSLSWPGETLLLPAVLLRQEEAAQDDTPGTMVVRFVDLNKESELELKDLLNRLWKRQRQAALAEAAQAMLLAHPDSFFR